MGQIVSKFLCPTSCKVKATMRALNFVLNTVSEKCVSCKKCLGKTLVGHQKKQTIILRPKDYLVDLVVFLAWKHNYKQEEKLL